MEVSPLKKGFIGLTEVVPNYADSWWMTVLNDERRLLAQSLFEIPGLCVEYSEALKGLIAIPAAH